MKTHNFLKPLKGPIKRRRYMTVDLESKEGKTQKAGFTRPFMAGVFTGESFHSFTNLPPTKKYTWDKAYFAVGGCVDRMMRFVLHRKWRNMYIYAHNGGRFDFLFLMPWLMTVGVKAGYLWELVPVASAIQMLKVRKRLINEDGNVEEYQWTFLDSYRLLPQGLERCAQSFGLPGKVQHDLNLHEHCPEWRTYLEQDCRLLYQILEHFHDYIENTLCGEVGMTLPSTAMKTFRRGYQQHLIHRNVDTHEFVRSSYCGGRTEVFTMYGENLRDYDINSSYPASMLEDMPSGEAHWWHGKPPKHLMEGRVGFVKARVTVPVHLRIPPLPIRGDGIHGPKNKLIFPVGRLEGIWEWSELQMALEFGVNINEWLESVWYDGSPIFTKYVSTLYRYRDKSREDYNQALDTIAKFLLNSLYGKFGQKLERSKLWYRDDPRRPIEGSSPLVENDLDCLIWQTDTIQDADFIIPQIAARVTSLSRQRLYRGIWEAEQNGGRVHYSDTDSVITTGVLETSHELGGWKDEVPELSGRLYGAFYGPKAYTLWGAEGWRRVKAKGLGRAEGSAKEREQILWEQFKALNEGKSIVTSRLEKVGSLSRLAFQRGPKIVQVPRTSRNVEGKRVLGPCRLEIPPELREHDTDIHVAENETHPHILMMW